MFISLFSLFLILCLIGEFGTVIIHGGVEMQQSFAQSQLHSGKETSTALEHAESTLINGTGCQLTESQYFPPYTLPSLISSSSRFSVCVCLVNVKFIYFVL